MKRELLVGCGNHREKRIYSQGDSPVWYNLTTLDISADCKPDIVHDLNKLPLPFDDNTFDEIHAYEVLEHCGRQGDYISFFALFSEFWRILKDKGKFIATVPDGQSEWVWGDPGHSRFINRGTLVFLSQEQYRIQIGKTSMTDYRSIYHADFSIKSTFISGESFCFILEGLK